MKTRDVMTEGARTCAPDHPLNCAAQIMWEHDCGCVPVVGDDGKAVGMITDRDICMAAYTQGRTLSEMQVSSAMSTDLVAVRDTDALDVAEQRMRERQVRRLPVLDAKGSVVGILSLSDIVRHTQTDARSNGAGPAKVTDTLAAICAPPERQADAPGGTAELMSTRLA